MYVFEDIDAYDERRGTNIYFAVEIRQRIQLDALQQTEKYSMNGNDNAKTGSLDSLEFWLYAYDNEDTKRVFLEHPFNRYTLIEDLESFSGISSSQQNSFDNSSGNSSQSSQELSKSYENALHPFKIKFLGGQGYLEEFPDTQKSPTAATRNQNHPLSYDNVQEAKALSNPSDLAHYHSYIFMQNATFRGSFQLRPILEMACEFSKLNDIHEKRKWIDNFQRQNHTKLCGKRMPNGFSPVQANTKKLRM